MAIKRVIAYFMHEHEQAAASQALRDAASTESFLIGNIDETDIPALRADGVIVEVLNDTPPEPLDELVATTRGANVPRAAIERNVMPAPDRTDRFTVQLAGPLIEPWRQRLADQGAHVIEVTGPDRYTIRLAPDLFWDVQGLDFVLRMKPYTSADAQPAMAPERPAEADRDFRQMKTFDIRLQEPDDLGRVLSWLDERRVAVAGQSRRKIRVYLMDPSPELASLQSLQGVGGVEEYVPPKLFNDHARILLGIDDNNTHADVLAQTGQGQIIAIADTGLDDQHPDFQGRIVGIVALGRKNDSSDPNGHGTHVAGSVLGDGAASNGTIRGTAPGASLFFQSIMDVQGRLGGLPLDLNDLFEEPYLAGARIHNNSWGAAVAAQYNLSSIEVDEFVHEKPDMTIVIAAGNEGSAFLPQNAMKGHVDWLSLSAPATAKNALTVGASRSDRTQGGYSTLTWKQAWPNDFPDDPIANEKVSGDPQSLAAFSSRGPCDDRRIKPDLVAPGTDIASTKSARAPLSHFWGSYPGFAGRYAYMGGTSMATPLVAGCAALVREYYEKERQHEASAALVKATLINGTKWLSGQDATSDFPANPNFHQGFGCIDMPRTLPNASEPNLKLHFIDSWQDPDLQFVRTGQRFRFRVRCGDRHPLRFCLSWTDLPARSLQNNLNLFVQYLPDGAKWLGNADLPLKLRLPDSENNVEIVRISEPQGGDYLIQITASNLLMTTGQAFALVVTGDLESELVPY